MEVDYITVRIYAKSLLRCGYFEQQENWINCTKRARQCNIKSCSCCLGWHSVNITCHFSCLRQTLTTRGPPGCLRHHRWQCVTLLETTQVWWWLTAHRIHHRETGYSQDHLDQGGIRGWQDTDMRGHKASGGHALPLPCHGCQQGGQQSASGVRGWSCSQETCRWVGSERDRDWDDWEINTSTYRERGGGGVERRI